MRLTASSVGTTARESALCHELISPRWSLRIRVDIEALNALVDAIGKNAATARANAGGRRRTRATLGTVDLPNSSPRILIVDNALSVVQILASFLNAYEVEIATSGAQALARLATQPAVDVVLCDLRLDDLDGRALYRQACARFPELRSRFVFMTGDQSSATESFTDEFSGVRVLSRPFEPALLLAVIRDMVSHPSPRPAA